MYSWGQLLTGLEILIEIYVIIRVIKAMPTKKEFRSQAAIEAMDHQSGSSHSHFYEDVVLEIRQIQIPIFIALILQFIGAFL